MTKRKLKNKIRKKLKNRITLYRRRMKLSQLHMAKLLGDADSRPLCALELGRSMPTLIAAFRLAIILRIPVEFLYPELYDSLRNEIRAHEERLRGGSRDLNSNHSRPST